MIFFIAPFAILYIISFTYYSDKDAPDLLRLGYIPNVYKNYRDAFQLNGVEKFDRLSKSGNKKFKIMTLGDSFSEQSSYGYKNILSEEFSLIHVDRFIAKNQIQTLLNMCNGDFFDTYEIEYVVLQNVERHIIESIKDISFKDTLMLFEIDSLIQSYTEDKEINHYKLFSSTTLTFPLYHFPRYIFSSDYLSNEQVYNVEIDNQSLFSNNTNNLLFFHNDLNAVNKNNLPENAVKLNNIYNSISNMLASKGIKLIVMPAVDKYDFYYESIVNKQRFERPLFFDNMRTLPKNYIYIDSKDVLMQNLNTKKDIYFYDDTHWSPIGTKIIAESIKQKIN
jgi:hypothetical protein